MSWLNAPHVPTILIVEDELLIRINVVESLKDAGYAVFETDSGEEAIAFCTSGTLIDAIFTDINLSGVVNGWDVADAFRLERPNVSVLYTSGKPADPTRCVPDSRFIAKPYHPHDVVATCQQLCGHPISEKA